MTLFIIALLPPSPLPPSVKSNAKKNKFSNFVSSTLPQTLAKRLFVCMFVHLLFAHRCLRACNDDDNDERYFLWIFFHFFCFSNAREWKFYLKVFLSGEFKWRVTFFTNGEFICGVCFWMKMLRLTGGGGMSSLTTLFYRFEMNLKLVIKIVGFELSFKKQQIFNTEKMPLSAILRKSNELMRFENKFDMKLTCRRGKFYKSDQFETKWLQLPSSGNVHSTTFWEVLTESKKTCIQMTHFDVNFNVLNLL